MAGRGFVCGHGFQYQVGKPIMQSTFEIHPLVLCGGSGTRLWPLSRKSYPKQFVQLIGDRSLYQ
jgi:hypothetical protein